MSSVLRGTRHLVASDRRAFRLQAPLYLSENLFGGAAPKRRIRNRDARLTFGSPLRTLALLAIRVLGSATIREVSRALVRFEPKVISSTLWRYESFGIFKATIVGGRTGVSFEFNPDYEFYDDLVRVVDQVGSTLAVWEYQIERSKSAYIKSSVRRHRTSKLKDAALRRWSKDFALRANSLTN